MDMSSTAETLKQEENSQSAQKKTTTISFPNEIVQEIISRLPIKPILQFRSVSKEWLSLISDNPSFRKLHFNRSLVTNGRTSFFISAYDRSTKERHFLSSPLNGGPITHLITLRSARNFVPRVDDTVAKHLKGLVLFTFRNGYFVENFAFVLNPATRKVFKLTPPSIRKHSTYLFEFDESNTVHKILSITPTRTHNTSTFEFMIFSLSTYSWKHIPVDLEKFPPLADKINFVRNTVCVNSVIHVMLYGMSKILAFDLTTEKFSIIDLPQGAISGVYYTWFTRPLGEETVKSKMPFLITANELLGVVCHDLVVETNKLHIWVLQDYVNRVWVRETITFLESWIEGGSMIPDYHDMENLVFSCRRLSENMVNACILDMKTNSFKLVTFNLSYSFLHSKTVKFRQVRSYVESILPLREE